MENLGMNLEETSLKDPPSSTGESSGSVDETADKTDNVASDENVISDTKSDVSKEGIASAEVEDTTQGTAVEAVKENEKRDSGNNSRRSSTKSASSRSSRRSSTSSKSSKNSDVQSYDVNPQLSNSESDSKDSTDLGDQNSPEHFAHLNKGLEEDDNFEVVKLEIITKKENSDEKDPKNNSHFETIDLGDDKHPSEKSDKNKKKMNEPLTKEQVTWNENGATVVHLQDKEGELLKETDEEDIDAKVHNALQETEAREQWGSKVEFLLASIGLAVGVGNVWRFPYLCQRHGGGAFLIPYITMMFVEGIPLFIMEYALGQRMKQSAVRCLSRIHPVFFGVGCACMLVSFAMCLYYIVIITWCFYYFFVSFTSNLPWQKHNCERYGEFSILENNLTAWKNMNYSDPYVRNMTMMAQAAVDNFKDCCVRNPSTFYWHERALTVSSGMNSVGDGLNGKLVGCLFAAWVVTYLCVIKGVKSSGKAVYFTATFPYIILFILFIRGVTLEGAGDGIKAFFTPDWDGVKDPRAWMDAATQMFYSLSLGFGALIAFSSYMPRKNNCIRDAWTVVLANCGTSVFAGIVVFSFLGHRQFKTGIPVSKIGSGPGLAFITFCEAFLLMDVSPLWSVLFFFMLVLLGIDSEFGTLEGAVAPLYDLQWVKMRKEIFMGICAAILFLVELPFCTGNGYYLFQVFDDYSVPFPLLIISLFQVVAVGWFYGTDRIANDIEYMTGKRPWAYWLVCWKYISPIAMFGVFVASVVKTAEDTPTYKTYVGCIENPFSPGIHNGTENSLQTLKYPPWAQGLAVVLVLASVFPIPIFLVKNWPKGWRLGFRKIFLSGLANYSPDPSWVDKSRRKSPEEMGKIVRDEDFALMKEQLVNGHSTQL